MTESQNVIPIDPLLLSDGDVNNYPRPFQFAGDVCHASAQEHETQFSEGVPSPCTIPEHRQDGSGNYITQDTGVTVADSFRGDDRGKRNRCSYEKDDGTSLHTGSINVEPGKATGQSSDSEQSTRHLSKRPRIDRAWPDREEVPYSLRSLFQRSSVNERTEFISWLFEGALSRCVSEPRSRHGSLFPDSPAETKKKPPKSRQTQRHKAARTPNGIQASERHSRKGEPWSTDEEELLIRLRKEQNLQWSEVTRQFAQQFPGRSQGSIQVYWCTKVERKRQEHHH